MNHKTLKYMAAYSPWMREQVAIGLQHLENAGNKGLTSLELQDLMSGMYGNSIFDILDALVEGKAAKVLLGINGGPNVYFAAKAKAKANAKTPPWMLEQVAIGLQHLENAGNKGLTSLELQDLMSGMYGNSIFDILDALVEGEAAKVLLGINGRPNVYFAAKAKAKANAKTPPPISAKDVGPHYKDYPMCPNPIEMRVSQAQAACEAISVAMESLQRELLDTLAGLRSEDYRIQRNHRQYVTLMTARQALEHGKGGALDVPPRLEG